MSVSGHSAWRWAGVLPGSRRKRSTVPDNIVLIMRFHPVGGEDVSVVCADFAGEREALEAIARALDEQRSLVLTRARYDRRGRREWRDHQPGQRGISAGVEDRQGDDGPVPV